MFLFGRLSIRFVRLQCLDTFLPLGLENSSVVIRIAPHPSLPQRHSRERVFLTHLEPLAVLRKFRRGATLFSTLAEKEPPLVPEICEDDVL